MLTVDISLPEVEELQKLVAEGQEKGFLTYDEIVNALEDVELTKEQVEDFYTYLIEHSIELMEGEQHNTYDIEFYGPNTMMGTFYLGALRAAAS